MTSIFGRLKSSATPGTPQTSSSLKKPGPSLPQTPLEKLLEGAGPHRNDGSDKFFGMLNAQNTCYCNSMVQCLYFSEPFREQIINYPRPGPARNVAPPEAKPLLNATTTLSPRTPATTDLTDPLGLQKSATSPPATASPQISSEGKDGWEHQKKAAFMAGPHLRLESSFAASYDMNESLFTVLKDLFETIMAYKSRMAIVTPAKFLEVLKKNHDVFRSNTHQDAHEFLITVLNSVVDEVELYSKNKAKLQDPQIGLGLAMTTPSLPANQAAKMTSSWVHELFEGTLTSETRCLTCENTSHRDETFMDLSVDLEEHSSVTSCLTKFSEEEMLRERNKFQCDKCGGLQEAEKRIKIKRLPRILALHLKRFKYYEEIHNMRKLFHRVVYPFHLRILNTTDDVDDPDRLYELYAVVVHLGATPFHGHYVAIIKSKDKGWFLFDDELVIPVDKNYVRGFFGGDPRNPGCAYVLFYQQTTEEAVQREQEIDEEGEEKPEMEGFDRTGQMMSTASDGFQSPPLTGQTARSTISAEELNNPFLDQAHAQTPSTDTPSQTASQSSLALDTSSGAESTPNLASVGTPPDTTDALRKSPSKGLTGSVKKSSNFNRFKNTSMSIRGKPKFWGSNKDGAGNAIAQSEADAGDSLGPLPSNANTAGATPVANLAQSTLDYSIPAPPPAPVEKEQEGKTEKKKGRFSLGRKRSSMLG